jgi:hypothetical protein
MMSITGSITHQKSYGILVLLAQGYPEHQVFDLSKPFHFE